MAAFGLVRRTSLPGPERTFARRDWLRADLSPRCSRTPSNTSTEKSMANRILSQSKLPPWLYLWLSTVFLGGLAYSFAQIVSDNFFPGSILLPVGFGIIVVAGILGGARTGKWTTFDGRVVPTNLEWFVALTGATLFVSPIANLLLTVSLTAFGLRGT